MNKYAIIMAGGDGTRLFPISTRNKPKQFLDLFGNGIMINETINRISKTIPVENIFIVINNSQKEMAEKYIDKRIDKQKILFEPKACNTATCICYAMTYITELYGDGIIGVFSTDHYVDDEDKFNNVLYKAMEYVKLNNEVIIIGTKPTFPSTQFGYIKYIDNKEYMKPVKEFKEKPNEEQAKEYIKNGYVWNSGIFIWNTYTIKRAFLDFMPQLYEKFQQIKKYFKTELFYEKLEKIYDIIEPISIDIGIIEKINNIRMVLADYEWRDIGSLKLLLDLYYNKKINLQNMNNCSLIKSNNITTFSENKERKFAIIGLENIVVVETNNICLIANADFKDEDLKKLSEKMDFERYRI